MTLLLRTLAVLGAALAVSGYSRPPESLAAEAARPARPPAPAPVGDFTLSFLEEAPEGHCRWMRADGPGDTPRALFSFEGSCDDADVAWSYDGRKGAVLLGAREESLPQRAWSVDLVAGKGTPLALPALGRTTHLGFDADGVPLALVWHQEPSFEQGEAILFEGEEYLGQALAHAFRWEAGAWKRGETKGTYAHYGEGFPEEPLDAFQTLGETTTLPSRYLVESSEIDTEEIDTEPESPQQLPPGLPEPGEDMRWVKFDVPGWPLFIRMLEAGDYYQYRLPLYGMVGHELVRLEARPAEEEGMVSLRGNALLLDTKGFVRLYDVNQRKKVFSRSGVVLGRFWPRPGGRAAAK